MRNKCRSSRVQDEAWRNSSWNLGMLIQLLLFIHSSALTSNEVYLVRHERRQWAFLDVERACQITPQPKLSNHSRHYNLPRVASHSWPCSRVHRAIVYTFARILLLSAICPVTWNKMQDVDANLTLLLTSRTRKHVSRFFLRDWILNLLDLDRYFIRLFYSYFIICYFIRF